MDGRDYSKTDTINQRTFTGQPWNFSEIHQSKMKKRKKKSLITHFNHFKLNNTH